MKRKFFLFMVLTILMASCHDMEPEVPTSKGVTETKVVARGIGRLKFNSVQDLNQALQEVKVMRASSMSGMIVPKDTAKGEDFIDMFTPVGDLQQYAEVDPIIALQMKAVYEHIDDTSLLGNETAYSAFGYDDLIPETDFAKLLNAKGEIEVNDTVYKVSAKGTYFFHSSLYSYFVSNFERYENARGNEIKDQIYLMDDKGIYRYETFDSTPTSVEDQDSELPDTINENKNAPVAPPVKSSYSQEVPWKNLPVYNADAKTKFGKFWQNLFGRKCFKYQIAKKRRVKTRFYYYDYKIHESIGALVVMEKKNLIGWSGTNAEKLTLNWRNIILNLKYKVNRPDNYYNKNNIYVSPVESKYIPGYDNKMPTVTILGYELTNSEINSLIKTTASEVYGVLKKKLRKDIPQGAQAFVFFGDKSIRIWIPDGFMDATNQPKLERKFYDKWRFVISLNFSDLKSSWKTWAKDMNDSGTPKVTLVGGEIRAAASLDNKWGGATIVKTIKD